MQAERLRLDMPNAAGEITAKQIFHIHNRPITKLLITDPLLFTDFLQI